MRVMRLPVVIAALVLALAPLPARSIERLYSTGIYPPLQRVVTSASSLVPVALLDLSVAVLLVAAVLFVSRNIRTMGTWRTLRRGVAAAVVVAAWLYLWFALCWGLHYRRVPLEQKLAYDAGQITRGKAMSFGRMAVERANALRQGHEPATADIAGLRAAFAAVEEAFGMPGRTVVAHPKPSLAGWYFRQAAIDGMTNPFFLEVIVHPDLLPFEVPFVYAHEWAHLAGFADEAEANFVAWLACIGGPPDAQYSGWLSAYEHIANGLPRDDRAVLRAALSPAVRDDLAQSAGRVARSNPAVRTAARGAYDTYLRANRIDEGIASYSAVVRLMLGTTFTEGWRPVRRF